MPQDVLHRHLTHRRHSLAGFFMIGRHAHVREHRQVLADRIGHQHLPSSNSCISATELIGLVIDAMLKIASLVIGAFASLSRQPIAS